MPTQQEIETNTSLLIQVSKDGNIQAVEHLIPISNPKHNNSCALQWAAANGHLECVKVLIPVSDRKAEESEALRWAAANKHFIDIVERLIPISDPKAKNSAALRTAAVNNHKDIIEVLVPVSDYNCVITQMKDANQDTTLLQHCVNIYEAFQQKERLQTQLSDIQHVMQKRKM